MSVTVDWSWPCHWFAEAAAEQALADEARAAGDSDAADSHEWTARYKERIGIGGVDGAREAIEGGWA